MKKLVAFAAIAAIVFTPVSVSAETVSYSFEGESSVYYSGNEDGVFYYDGTQDAVISDGILIATGSDAQTNEEKEETVLNISDMVIVAHESRRLYVLNYGGKVKWTSSDRSVCTVSSLGVVRGKHEGSAVVTGKAKDGKVYTCDVTVLPYMENTATGAIAYHMSTLHFLYDQSSVNITKILVGEFKEAPYLHKNVYDYKIYFTTKSQTGGTQNMQTLYRSADDWSVTSSYFSETNEGQTGSFSAEELARTNELYKNALEGRYVAKYDTALHLNTTQVAMRSGKSYDLEVINTGKKAKWSTSDKNIVTVKDGVISAGKEGMAVITVKIGNRELTCTVYVIGADYTDEEMAIFDIIGNSKVSAYDPESVEVLSIDKGMWSFKDDGDAMMSDMTGFASVVLSAKVSDGSTRKYQTVVAYNNLDNGYRFTASTIELGNGSSGFSGTVTGSYDAGFVQTFNERLQEGMFNETVSTE